MYRFFQLVSENEDQEEETRSIADSFMNPSLNSMDYSACCLSSATNVTNCGPNVNGKKIILIKVTTNVLFQLDCSIECVSFEYLDMIPVEEYLINKRIITDQQRGRVILSERNI